MFCAFKILTTLGWVLIRLEINNFVSIFSALTFKKSINVNFRTKFYVLIFYAWNVGFNKLENYPIGLKRWKLGLEKLNW